MKSTTIKGIITDIYIYIIFINIIKPRYKYTKHVNPLFFVFDNNNKLLL